MSSAMTARQAFQGALIDSQAADLCANLVPMMAADLPPEEAATVHEGFLKCSMYHASHPLPLEGTP